MVRYKSDLFDYLKSNRSFRSGKRSAEEPFFQIRFDKHIPRLFVINSKGDNYQPTEEYFGGYTKKILRAISNLEDKRHQQIDWGDRKPGIDLSENEFLMLYLGRSKRLVDEEFKAIHFIDQEAQLVLTIEGETQLQCEISLVAGDRQLSDFSLISDSYAISNNCVMSIPPIGENFGLINAFNTIILPSELNGYLSLLCSYFENIPVEYRDYKNIDGLPLQASSALIFEKIDPANSLHLRVSQTIPAFEPDFVDNYDLSKIVQVKDLEREIHIRDVDYRDQSQIIKKINRLVFLVPLEGLYGWWCWR